MGFPMPPAFLWYYQYGYKERWNDPENNDPTMKRSFDEYVEEAIEKGWWGALREGLQRRSSRACSSRPAATCCGASAAGQKLLLEHLWPKLTMIVSVDYRITTTGLYSDYILPAAQHYEKLGHSMPSVHHLNWCSGRPGHAAPGRGPADLGDRRCACSRRSRSAPPRAA